MKTISQHSQGAAELARQEIAKRGAPPGAAVADAVRPNLRVIEGDKPKLPDWSASARIEISPEGRAKLAEMAAHAEREFTEGDPQDTIAALVADGIDEGWLE